MNQTHDFSTRRTAHVAVLSALSLSILSLSSLSPTGRIGIVAASGLIPAAAVVSFGLPAGFLCYGVAGLLGLLLIPNKSAVILYLLFFGLYPMVKGFGERLKNLPLGWGIKLAFFNLSLSMFWFGLRAVFIPFLPPVFTRAAWIVYLAGNIVFIFYDIGFTKLIAFYTTHIAHIIRKA